VPLCVCVACRIVVGGDSAGAITSLYLGYLKEATEGSSGNPGYSSQVNVTVSVSGMLGDKGFCDRTSGPPRYEPYGCAVNNSWDYTHEIGAEGRLHSQPALAFISGTSDLTCPYYYALEAIRRATAVGLPHTFITVPGGGHVPFEELFANEGWMRQLFNFIAAQLQPPCPPA
jgi:acetyl esterase/lipase